MNNLSCVSTLIQQYPVKRVALGLFKQTVTIFVSKERLADFIVQFSAATQSPVPRNFAIYTRVPEFYLSIDQRGSCSPESIMFFDPIVDKADGKLLGQNITIPFDSALADFSNFAGIEHDIVIKDLRGWLCRTFSIAEDFETTARPKTSAMGAVIPSTNAEPSITHAEYLVSLINTALKSNTRLWFSSYEFSSAVELQDWFLTFNL